MEIVKKNNRKFYCFKIEDEFKVISGKGSFTKMVKDGLASKTFDKEKNFIYPFYDSSTLNNHIKGYSKIYNFDGEALKISQHGCYAGKVKYIKGKSYIGHLAYLLCSKNFCNYYIALFFSNFLTKYKQGTSIHTIYFCYYSNQYIEIPTNHKLLSKHIQNILKYKQLCKQLSKQFEYFKISILQESKKFIQKCKETNQLDKFYRIKIEDEFKVISGKGSFNKMVKEGLASKTFDKEKGFIYPFYDASTVNNHIKGYCKEYNFEGDGIKVSVSGVGAGKSTYINNKIFLGTDSLFLLSKNFCNWNISLFLNIFLPSFQQGTAIKHVFFSDFKKQYIEIPKNHNKLSKVIEKIITYQELMKKTTILLNNYIKTILKISLGG